MRFGGLGFGLALCAALWAAGASAQTCIADQNPGPPCIVDPDPASDLDWGLRLEPVASGLDSPSALAFFGRRINEEFLVLEKNTGKVRYFRKNPVEQGVALDLAVDSCGERGLVGIALHPNFDTTKPENVQQPDLRWVYLSYHTDPGRVDDVCVDAADEATAVLRVERYKWDDVAKLLVPDPVVEEQDNPNDPSEKFEPFEEIELSSNSITAVGGTITVNFDQSFDGRFVPRLFVAMGSLGLDGTLQNNETITPRVFDDTGVILRLDQNGETPAGNPFDHDADQADPEDRYFAYGVRNPRGLAGDPFSLTLWFTELSDADQPDEITGVLAGDNGGYRDLQGRVALPAGGSSPLVDLQEKPGKDADSPPVPVSTYQNASFAFENKAVEPTGLSFAGRETGTAHVGRLFVGSKDGRLLRFLPNQGRDGFFLSGDLTDAIADADDDVAELLVAQGFGAISDIETGVGGSIYVLDKDFGKVYRVFSDARRDLVITRAKVPARISLSAARPTVTKSMKVTIENHGEVSELLFADDLAALLGVEISGLPPADCTAPIPQVVVPWYAQDPYEGVLGVKPNGKLSLAIDVSWACPNSTPSPKGEFDFETSFHLNGAVIGIDDEDSANDVCPRLPSADDKGCGGKGGGPLLTDVVVK